MNSTMKKTLIASSVALAFGTGTAQAAGVNDIYGNASFSTLSANFTMLSAMGATVGGTNNVNMVWDGDGFNASSDYTGPGSYANVTAASTTAFFGHKWTAHDIQVFVPGSYSFDTSLAGGNPESGMMNVTVPTGYLGMHMLFNWNNNNNIDVFVVAAPSSIFGAGVGRSTNIANCDQTASASAPMANCLWDGAGLGPDGKPAGNKVWMMASVDGNSDGIMGIPMAAGGPFAGFNANFNATLTAGPDVSDIPSTIPVPAAVWLFGSGLLGLVGVARRKKA